MIKDCFFVFLSFIVFRGGFVDLLKDGGARPEGFDNFVGYDGPLTLAPYIFGVLVFYVYGKIFINYIINIGGNKYFIVFFLVLFISSIFSENTVLAFKAYFLIISGFCLCVGICERGDFRYALNVFSFIMATIVLASYISALFFPSYGVSVGIHAGHWQGVFSHKNYLGQFCVVSLAIFLANKYINQTVRLLFIFLCVCLSFLSGSTASFFISIIVLFVYWISDFLWRVDVFIAKTLISISLFVPVIITFIALNFPGIQIGEKDASISGRDAIWRYFIDKFFDNIFFGAGLSQISTDNEYFVDDILKNIGFVASSTHSGYVDLLYSSGLIGCFVFVVSLFFFDRYKLSRSYNLMYSVVLFSVLLLNSFESVLVMLNPVLVTMMLVFVLENCHDD
jgi:O-antigen ligase